MPHLQRLPDELLALILDNLSNYNDIAAISVQFRRVHRICDLATRRRYRRIRIRKDEHLNPAFEILLSILRKPHLGTYVRHLEVDRQPVHSGEYRKVENADCLRSLSQGDLDLVKKAARRIPCTGYDEDTFLNMLMQRKIDISPPGHRSSFYAENTDRGVFIGQAIAVLLMSVCPALESLVLGAPFRILGDGLADPSQNGPQHCTLPFPLDKFIQSVSTPSDIPSWKSESGSPYLQEVRKIEFLPRPYLSKKWYSPCDINRCLALTSGLPKLHAISVDGMKGFPMRHMALELTPNNIQSIELHRSLIATKVLIPLLCAPNELRNFQYTSGYIGGNPLAELGGSYGHVGRRAHGDERYDKFNFTIFLGGILRHRETLESLEVDCDHHLTFDRFPVRQLNERLRNPPWSLSYPGSLKDLTALISLDVGVRLFFRLVKGHTSEPESSDLVHELPPRLRSLTIRGYEKGEIPEQDNRLEKLERGVGRGLHPCLKDVRGIREHIPAGEYVPRETWLGGEDPDFKLEEWTDYDE